MAIFSVIDTGTAADNWYEGMVKDAANWATLEASLSAATTNIFVGGGAGVAPVATTATGTGAPVRAGSPTFTVSAILSGLTASLPVFSDANKSLVSKSVADTQTALGIGAWTNYSATSVVTGLSVLASNIIDYKVIEKIVFVKFYIGGTSNANTFTFTLPIAQSSGDGMLGTYVRGIDNGTALDYPSYITMDTNVISVFKSHTTATWTTSGTKRASGQFFYQIA